MLERVPTVLTAQEILDKAFSKAMKIDIPDPVRYHRIRKTELARLQSVCDSVAESLGRYPKAFPNMDSMRDWNVEVLDIVTGLPELKKALGSVRWASEKVLDLKHKSTMEIGAVRTVELVKQIQNRCYGRLSSVVKEVNKDLNVLRDTRDKVRGLPSISPDFATLVIAGYPNVGKTSLLRSWTNSRAEVNNYAFTTKHAEVGHFEIFDSKDVPTKIQVVDTPGLLDRPDDERNDVEKQAMAALRLSADAVLFLLDPSEQCGYSMEAQEALLAQVEQEMAGLPFLVAQAKADLHETPGDRMGFSVVTGQGMQELKDAVLAMLPIHDEVELEQDPMDAWTAKRHDSRF